jgi:hypothetical protein
MALLTSNMTVSSTTPTQPHTAVYKSVTSLESGKLSLHVYEVTMYGVLLCGIGETSECPCQSEADDGAPLEIIRSGSLAGPPVPGLSHAGYSYKWVARNDWAMYFTKAQLLGPSGTLISQPMLCIVWESEFLIAATQRRAWPGGRCR